MSAWSFHRNKLVSLVVTVAATAQLIPNPVFAQTAQETPNWEALTKQATALETAGDLPEAEKVFNQAYQLSKTFENDDVRRMEAMENLGRALELEGRYATAQSIFQESLELRQKEHGDGSPRLSRSLYNLGRMQLLSGDYASARHNLTKTLNSRRLSSSEEKNQQDLPLVFILFNLGVLEKETGNFDKARNYLNRCQTIAQNIARHKENARVLSQLALLSLAEDDYTKAASLANTSLSMADKFAKDDVLVKAEALNTVAIVKTALGEFKEAAKACDESWSIKRKALGAHHPLTADSLLTAGLIKLAEKNYEGADKDFGNALVVYDTKLNHQQLNYSRALIGRAFAELKLKHDKDSKQDLEQGVASLTASTGAAKDLPAQYKALYNEKHGLGLIAALKAKLTKSDGKPEGQLDIFGQMVSMSLSEKVDPDKFYSIRYKDLFTALGIGFVVLILLTMAILTPGVFSRLIPWGRGREEQTKPLDAATEKTTPSSENIRRPELRRTTESERRQVQVWKGRLSTMEKDQPNTKQTNKTSGAYERIDFQPYDPSSSTSIPMLQNPTSQTEGSDRNW